MTQEVKSIPKWILIVSGILGLLQFMVCSILIFSPQSMLKTVDLNANGVDYLIYMWAARQFALGFIFLLAIFKKSTPMLTTALIFFFVMNIGDLFVGISQNDTSLIIGAGVVCVLAPAMIYFLTKKTH